MRNVVKHNSVCCVCKAFVKHSEIIFVDPQTGDIMHQRCANETFDEQELIALADKLGYQKVTL